MNRTLLAAVAAAVMTAASSAMADSPAAAPADQAVTVGEEITLASGDQSHAAGGVAFGADLYLAAWTEGEIVKGRSARVRAARVSKDGQLLDAQPIDLSSGNGGQQDHPRVAFGGGNFVMVWHEFNGKDCDVLGVRVSPQGKVLGTRAIQIAVAPRTQALPEVAASDKTFVVAFQSFVGEETTASVSLATVSLAGEPAAAAQLAASRSNPRIAWNGSQFLVTAFPPNSALMRTTALRLDAQGQAIPKSGAAVCYGVGLASLCGTPDGWVFIVHRAVPDFWGWGGPGAMRAFAVRQTGEWDPPRPEENKYPKMCVLEPTWLDVATGKDPSAYWPWGPSTVAWNGRHAVAAWTRFHYVNTGPALAPTNGDLMVGRFDGWKPIDQGTPITVAATDSDERNPALAADGAGKLLCVYEKQKTRRNTEICTRMLAEKP